jgi:hypoxanthine-DNA glycosylase
MQQYYALPRNAFWPIMGRLLEFEPDLPYDRRVATLKKCRIALWDVCASAERAGSLDSSIIKATVRPNDFVTFLSRHRSIRSVYFNGGRAEALYSELVLPRLPVRFQQLEYVSLPSTSPAHAGITLAAKLRRWSSVRRASATGLPVRWRRAAAG